jgi:hypothetical protein
MRYPTASKEELKAPKSKFRVLGIDVHAASGMTYVVGDFDSLNAANVVATDRAGVGKPIFIYDDAGEVVVRLGSWH